MLWCAARLGRAPDGRCRACRVSSRRDGILICARQFRLTNTRHRSRIAMPGPGQPRLPRAKDVSRRSVGDTSAGTNAGARRDPDRGKALVRLSCRGASAFRAKDSSASETAECFYVAVAMAGREGARTIKAITRALSVSLVLAWQSGSVGVGWLSRRSARRRDFGPFRKAITTPGLPSV
jgi:hypothetical protein